MGILSGFIGGAARATGEIANQRIARYTAEELQRQRDLMDQEREKRIEEAQIAREGRAVAQRDKERTDTVSRIKFESENIAKSEVEKEGGLIYSKQHLLEQTPEWQEKTDRELELKRQSLAKNPDTMFQAAINTGDISARDAQGLIDSKRRLDIAESQQETAARNAEMRDATERYKADLKAKSDEAKDATQNRRFDLMFSSIGGGANGKVDKVMSFLEGTRKSLNSESDRLSDLMKSELKSVEYDPAAQATIRAEYKSKFDQLNLQQKNLNDDFNSARQRFGLPAREDSKPSSAQPTNDPIAAQVAKQLEQMRKGNAAQAQSNVATQSPTARQEAPAPRASTDKKSLSSVLSDGSTDKSVLDLNSKNAQKIQLATDEVKRASSAFAAASKSGDSNAAGMYRDKLNEAKRNLDLLLKDTTPQKREAVYEWAGI